MATFRPLPSGNWNAQVRIKGKSPQSKTFSTKSEAESWAKQIEAVTMDHKHHTIYTLGDSTSDATIHNRCHPFMLVSVGMSSLSTWWPCCRRL